MLWVDLCNYLKPEASIHINEFRKAKGFLILKTLFSVIALLFKQNF